MMKACSLYNLLFLLLVVPIYAGTDEEGLKFLKENKEKPGVIELPSGLQYKILRNGTGIFHPAVDTSCSCHYEGTLIDGTKFDSSYDRGQPTTFAPNQVIAGWTEIMQLMVEGDKFEMYIPSELGYGDRGSPPKIPGGSVLIFTMEILEILGDNKVPALKCLLSGDNCNEKETTYLKKIKGWDETKQKSEVKRLQSLLQGDSKLKADLEEWIQRRLHILKQLVPEEGNKEEL